MIEQFFESKRPKPTYVPRHYSHHQPTNITPYYTPMEYNGARLRNITPMEYRRRDNLVVKAAQECPFEVGDTGYPIHAKAYEKYGACTVVHVTHSLKECGVDDTWPKNDNPFIVGFRPTVGKQDIILCTNHYLSKENRHLEVSA